MFKVSHKSDEIILKTVGIINIGQVVMFKNHRPRNLHLFQTVHYSIVEHQKKMIADKHDKEKINKSSQPDLKRNNTIK